LTYSEIGYILSYVILWKIVDTNPDLNRICIFEDDARTHITANIIYELLRDFNTYISENNIPKNLICYI